MGTVVGDYTRTNYIDRIAQDIFFYAHGGGAASKEDRVLYRIYAVLALAKGEATTMEDVHDAWAAWTAEDRPDHESLIRFDKLRPDIQEMDRLYMDAIHDVARRKGYQAV